MNTMIAIICMTSQMPVITAQTMLETFPFPVFLLCTAQMIKHASEIIHVTGYRIIEADSIPNGRKYANMRLSVRSSWNLIIMNSGMIIYGNRYANLPAFDSVIFMIYNLPVFRAAQSCAIKIFLQVHKIIIQTNALIIKLFSGKDVAIRFKANNQEQNELIRRRLLPGPGARAFPGETNRTVSSLAEQRMFISMYLRKSRS